jgi:formylmethanofuran dehydrogenase subunit E-like metal-binding protein
VEATDTIHKEMKLIVSGECTRENAATVLEKMMDSHLFVNVLKDQRYKFKDDAKALYQYVAHYSSQVHSLTYARYERFVEPKVWSVLHLKERYDTSKIGAARVKAHGVSM